LRHSTRTDNFTMGDIPISDHSPLNIILILSTLVTFIITAIFNALAGSGAALGSIFLSSVGNISDVYQMDITPAGFTFSIWSVIYLWIAFSLLFFIITIFIKTDFGRLYMNPQILTPAVTATLNINFILNLAWIFVWDRTIEDKNLIILAAVILPIIAITNMMVIAFMTGNIAKHCHEFQRGSPLFWWGMLYRFVVNGLAIYTTWTTIASLINIGTALVYVGGVSNKDASLAMLSLLVIIHCTWFALENFVFDKYVRFILTQYLVVIWAINGVRAKKMDDENVPQEIKDFVLAILIIAAITFVVRVAIVIYRYVKKPMNKMSTVTGLSTK